MEQQQIATDNDTISSPAPDVLADLIRLGIQHATYCGPSGAVIVLENGGFTRVVDQPLEDLNDYDVLPAEQVQQLRRVPSTTDPFPDQLVPVTVSGIAPAVGRSSGNAPAAAKRRKINDSASDALFTLLRQTQTDFKNSCSTYKRQNDVAAKMLDEMVKTFKS